MHRNAIVATPAMSATAVASNATALATSHTIIVRRRSVRSTKTPAGSDRTRYGRVSRAARIPSSNGPA